MGLWGLPGSSRAAQAALAVGWCALALSIGALEAGAAADLGAPALDRLARPAPTASARGDFDAVIREQDAALARSRAAGDRAAEADALLRRGEAQVALGHLARGADDLAAALALAEAGGDARRIAVAAGSLGNAYLLAGRQDLARSRLERSLAVARQASLPGVAAITLNNLGNLRAAQGAVGPALDAYDEGERLALAAGDRAGAVRAGLNAARLMVHAGGDGAAARARLDGVLGRLEGLPPSHEHALSLVAAGSLLAELAGGGEPAEAAFRRAADMASTLGDARTESQAYGHLGRIYEERGRPVEALAATRRALFLAQAADAPDALYQWQWQAGRLQAEAGDIDAAIAAYRGAVTTLQALRLDLPDFDPATGRSLFREAVGPVYVGLADLLLRRAALVGDRRDEDDLRDARRTIELLKTAELENYFEDDCVADLQRRVREVDRLGARTAAVYPIILPDRTALLLSLPDGLRQVTVPVAADDLTAEVRALRLLLEKRTTRQFLPGAQRLYDWLIRPIEPDLAAEGITTLVFVPDGALRTVPLAALHDGERFVAERYAVATVPGLSLLDPRPISRTTVRPLLNGLTESVQGFPPLPHVESELAAIGRLYPATVLKDAQFVAPALERSLAEVPFSVVHIASHGEFAGDRDDSFLLTYDGRLDMDELEEFIKLSRFREEPVELLTLSACRTAAGDDRAALGLAGVAIKAGARSALASLWFINDQSSSLLVTEFYRQLGDPAVSKAEALRRAQLAILADPRYRHPAYWAPFLIIGNWL